MDNHPIPQDVTGFQFKLIGDMTIKQFAYLAGGIVVAYVFFVLPLYSLIKLPLVFGSTCLGIALAFIPLEGRPLDLMLFNYLRALFTPNIYLFQKKGWSFDFPLLHKKNLGKRAKNLPSVSSKKKLKVFLQALHQKEQTKLDEKEMTFLASVSAIFNGKTLPTPSPQLSTFEELNPKPIFTENNEADKQIEQDEKIKKALEEETILIKKELDEAKIQEQKKPGAVSAEELHQKILNLEKQLNETLAQKDMFEKELLTLKQKINSQNPKSLSQNRPQPQLQVTPNVRKVSQDMGKKVGLPIMPEAPNIIAGIVKDSRGNVLPNILIEVKDSEGNPVRAFKTSGLGQFISSTPLVNGTYTLEFEDPKETNKFDLISITATGELLSPLEVISTDEREELRKMLFSKSN